VTVSEAILTCWARIGVSFPNLTTAIQNAVETEDLGVAKADVRVYPLARLARSGVGIVGGILTARLQTLLPRRDIRLTAAALHADCGSFRRGGSLSAMPFRDFPWGRYRRNACIIWRCPGRNPALVGDPAVNDLRITTVFR